MLPAEDEQVSPYSLNLFDLIKAAFRRPNEISTFRHASGERRRVSSISCNLRCTTATNASSELLETVGKSTVSLTSADHF